MALIISPAASGTPTCCRRSMTYRNGRWECDRCYGWQTAAAPGTGALGLLLAVAAMGLAAAALTGPGTGRRTRGQRPDICAWRCWICGIVVSDSLRRCPVQH